MFAIQIKYYLKSEELMKRIAEKVALVAHICITFIFALLTVLYVTNAIPQEEMGDNSIVIVLLLTLAVVYVGLSIFLIYVNFSEKVNVKRILLYYDNGGETRAKASVVDNIVHGCAKQVKELKVQRLKIRLDDKLGLIATIYVKASVENIADSIERLRVLLVDSFKETLGLTFNTINFEISQLTKKFVPAVKPSSKENKAKAQSTTAFTKGKDKPQKPAESEVTPVHEFEIVTPIEQNKQSTVATNAEPIEVEYEDVSEEK